MYEFGKTFFGFGKVGFNFGRMICTLNCQKGKVRNAKKEL